MLTSKKISYALVLAAILISHDDLGNDTAMPHKKTIFLFRHGQTDWNKQKLVQGQMDIPLNDTGKLQAENLALLLGNRKIQHVISSDLQRAAETARIVARHHACPVDYTPSLREIHFGSLQGTPLNPRLGATLWHKLLSKDPIHSDMAFPGGETKAQLQARVGAIISMMTSTQHQCVALSSHSTILRLLLQTIMAGALGLSLPNAGCVELSYDVGKKTWEKVSIV
jgi:broad specificity phosphatase PhoE